VCYLIFIKLCPKNLLLDHLLVHLHLFVTFVTFPEFEEGYSKYKDAKLCHEAGYDAFVAGFVYIRLAHYIGNACLNKIQISKAHCKANLCHLYFQLMTLLSSILTTFHSQKRMLLVI
jgi:hypothetical protein